ncbi:MAG: UDP-glucose 4-epimerase GalE [Deltaproteobacteria bacterium]|nr:UDP-glucose 4-epimerase GalE [Deltaproteobacteria bacterium]
MNILVTGGAGYIGSHCCKALFRKGMHPVTIDNLVYGHRNFVRWGEFFQGDVGNSADLKKLFSRHQIDAVMHFAAYAYVGESVQEPLKYYENNLRNTIELLHAVVENGIQYVVFSSTCATYGNPEKIPIDEKHPQNPINPYGRTKRMIEEILEDYAAAYDLKYTSLRYFNAAGADPDGEIGEDHDPETHLIPLVLDVAAARRPSIKIFGTDYQTPDGTCVRDYIHVTDLAEAHILALQRLMDGAESSCYNLGTGSGFSVLEVIERARQITGQTIRAENTGRRPGDPPVLIASNEKAVSELGWNPVHADLDDIIRTAWRWHRKL